MVRPRDAKQDGGRYRAYCDLCGRNLAQAVTTLFGARKLAEVHAKVEGHEVRIEPELDYSLVELVRPKAH